ncbi:MAG TPA: cell division protein ZapA [Nitrospiraceae bacterium]|nr:cell division protein ZapA [Nitrospiraceae bacterium]
MIKTIDVEICGQRYAVQGEADDGYVQRLADYVDEQMRGLSKSMKTATMSKLAVLAAINITHQLFQVERMREEGDADINRRATNLMESIEEHLHIAAPLK